MLDNALLLRYMIKSFLEPLSCLDAPGAINDAHFTFCFLLLNLDKEGRGLIFFLES